MRMLHFSKLLPLLINIDQKTVLNWFGIVERQPASTVELLNYYDNGITANAVVQPSVDVSLETFRLIIEGLWEKVQIGLTLADIENLLFFILCVRFVILVIRYNLKTSLYITCIGLFAGYLWYRHLIDLISVYRSVLLRLPYLHRLGMDALQLRGLHRQMVLTDLRLGDNVRWDNPAQLIYYAFTKGITHVDPVTSLRYYIDPLSMVVSNLEEPTKSNILPFYYKVYNRILPKIVEICSKFWNQMSGIVAYAIVTRIGKRYCPYLVRWHWTFLLIIGLTEQPIIYLIYRIFYFQTFVLIPQTTIYNKSEEYEYVNQSLLAQVEFLNAIITVIVLLHIGLVILGMLHAISGQYFYFPFFVENTELHIGPRPKGSVYSGGNTSWQDSWEKKKNLKRIFPKFWFGWFGRGTYSGFNPLELVLLASKRSIKSLAQFIRKKLRR